MKRQRVRIEEWRPCPGFQGLYEVSSLGRYRRSKNSSGTFAGFVLKQRLDKEGYPVARLKLNGKRYVRFLSRLICEAFHGPAPTVDHRVVHLDGDIANNCAANIEWQTYAYERKPPVKANETKVIEIPSANTIRITIEIGPS